MRNKLLIGLVVVLLIGGLVVACGQGPSEYDLEQDEQTALLGLQMRYLAEYFPGLVVDVGESPEGVQRAIERIGILDQSGYGFEGWNGSDIQLYAAEEATLSVDIDGAQGLVHLAVPTSVGTATPVIMADSKGGLSNVIEVRKNATPVFYVDADGNVNYTGMSSDGGLISAAVGVRAPTAVGTATPAFFADSAGGQSNPFEVRYNETPVVVVDSAGALTASGLLTGAGVSSSDAAYVAVPTAVGTATPALFANSAGGVGNLFELRQAATPVVQVDKDGAAKYSNTIKYLYPLSEKGSNYTVTAADSGTWFVNTAGITYTLPTTPSAGLWWGFLVSDTTGITITLDSGDQILWETNAAGDRIAAHSSGEAFQIVAQGASKYLPVLLQGTIDDAD